MPDLKEIQSHVSELVDVKRIHADWAWNVRGVVSLGEVRELKEEIKRDGLLQPVVVRPTVHPDFDLFLVAGFRRFRCIQSLGWEKVSAVIIPGLTELQYRSLNLKENLDRKQLNILQEARGIEKYKQAGWNQKQVAEELGQSSGWVSVRFMLLDMEPEIQECAAAGMLSQDNIRLVHDFPPGFMRMDAVKQIKVAKEKGEKSQIELVMKLGRKTNPMKAIPRKPREILQMNEAIGELIGFGFATRLAGWCAGEVSDIEIMYDLREEAKAAGKRFVMPEHWKHIKLRD